MSPSDPLFRLVDATRCSFWGNNSFSIWLTDDAFCGVQTHKQDSSAGLFPFDLIPLSLDAGLVGIALCFVVAILFIPFAITFAVLSEKKQRRAQDRLNELDPTSGKYLMWDSKNLRLDLSGIARAEFFEPKVHISSAPPIQNMRLHLENGEAWHFTLPTRQEAEELQSLLGKRNILTTRREAQSLSSYLAKTLLFPFRTT